MEDQELVRQIISCRQTRCYADIVGRYSGTVFSKTIGIVKRRDLAAEITQQTFVKAYMNLGDWRGGPSIGPWLTAIAAHLALNALDKEQRHRQVPITCEPVAEDYSPEREQRLQSMEAAVRQLPEHDRQLIEQHYYQRLSTKEIARQTGLTQANVLVRLHRIRERLRNILKQETDE